MFRNEYELTVDLKKRMTAVTPTFVQYDNAKLIFKIFDNGKPYDLTEFTKAEVSHKRADGKTVVGTATIELSSNGQSQIVYQYLGNEMSRAGFNDTSLSIFSIDKKVSIQPFRVHIITDLRDGLVESSKEEAGVLQELIAQVGALVDSASTAVTNAEQAVIAAEQAVIDANTAQVTAQTAADGANLARDEALLAAQSATDATTATTDAIANTVIATTNADTATGIANIAANNADAKASLADLAASKVDGKIVTVDQAIIEVSDATINATTVISDTLAAKNSTELATTDAITATTNADAKALLAGQSALDANASALNADTKASLAEQKSILADTATVNANLATDAINTVLPNIEGWVSKGEYNPTTTYAKHNMVTLNGSTYQAKNPTTGNPPTDTLYWSLMAQRGVDGTGSVVSVNNIPPDINGNVDIGAISSTWVDITGKPSEFTPSAHIHVISDVTGLQTALDNAGTKDIATPLINGLMSKEDKGKLDGVEIEANKYVHPTTHPASMIIEDPSRRFVSDVKLTELNEKETIAGAQAKATLAENNAKTYTDTTVTTQISTKVDKVAGKGLSAEDFTSTEKTKLSGIAANANNYTHPVSHPASIITQDANNRFMTDAEKTKLTGIATDANNYVHPANHPASIIIQDASNRLVTDAQITSWNGKSGFDGSYSNLTNIPTTFAPTAHTHTVADVTGLQTELDKIGVLSGSVDAHTTQLNNHESRLGLLETDTGTVATNVAGLYRGQAWLILKQAVADRIDGGVTFADAMDGNSFGMTFDATASKNIIIRNGKMLMNNIEVVPHTVVDKVVVGVASTTSGSGGRRLARLIDGTIVFCTFQEAVPRQLAFYKIGNDGQATLLCTSGYSPPAGTIIYMSMVAVGNTIHCLASDSLSTEVNLYTFDASKANGGSMGAQIGYRIAKPDSGQTKIDSLSLDIDPTNGHIHAAWASKNASYPNAFNIRHSKSVNEGVTWSVVEQVTKQANANVTQPSLSLSVGRPVITARYDGSTNQSLQSQAHNGTTFVSLSWNNTYDGAGYAQSSPSSYADKAGVIRVAWHGRDATHTTTDYIRYSKSNDGATWSAMKKLVAGTNASISENLLEHIFITYQDAGVTKFIKSINNGDSWSAPTTIGTGTNPSTLDDNSLEITVPLTVRMGASNVLFNGEWSAPEEVPKLTASVVYNLPSTDYVGAFVQKTGALTTTAFLNDLPMDSDLLDGEYLFDKSLPAKAPAKLRIELSRASISGGESDAVTRILGGRS